jgi:CPA1 family monovalent cation:H+ antiporter
MTSLGTNTETGCEHFLGIDESKVSPRTPQCEECEKEGTDWVALRMCLVCGHVGCCDSSEGLHATRHYKQTRHPVMHYLINNGNGAMFISNILENC